MIREQMKTALTDAMRAHDKPRVETLRLMLAALKNRDIELRQKKTKDDDDAVVVGVLAKMAKQRDESITMFERGGRSELADAERAELQIIRSFLPAAMSEADLRAAVTSAIARVGATSMKDMGAVMAELKQAHGTGLDMGKASGLVRGALQP